MKGFNPNEQRASLFTNSLRNNSNNYKKTALPTYEHSYAASTSQSSNNNNSLNSQANNDHIKTNMLNKPPPAEVVFNIDSKHQFRDFRPLTFKTCRLMSGFSDSDYLYFISQPFRERLSEGASGAFFFFCGKGELIVKTVEKHEAKTLLGESYYVRINFKLCIYFLGILDNYVKHLSENPDSLLVRFLGLHSITM